MVAIDFPASPTPGQSFPNAGVVWTWDGVKWTALGNNLVLGDAPADGQLYGRKQITGNMSWAVAAAGLSDAPGGTIFYGRKGNIWVQPSHTDISDWTATLAPYALSTSVPVATAVTPLMDGTAAVGTAPTWARGDHKHPTDTSRYAATNPSGYISDAPNNTNLYGRQGAAWAVFTPGVSEPPDDGTTYGRMTGSWAGVLPLSGGVMGGNITFNLGAGVASGIFGAAPNGNSRWAVNWIDGSAESGSNTGSNFSIQRYSDTGSVLGTPLSIERSSGLVSVAVDPVNPSNVATKHYVDAFGSGFLPISGGTLSGNLAIAPGGGNWAALTLAIPTSGLGTVVQSTVANKARWAMSFGDGTAESGSNVGSNWSLQHYNDAGVTLGAALSINRASGAASFQSSLSATTTLSLTESSAGSNAYVGYFAAGGTRRGYTGLVNGVMVMNSDQYGTSIQLGSSVSIAGNVSAPNTISYGALSGGAITCSTINTQGNGINCGGITNTGSTTSAITYPSYPAGPDWYFQCTGGYKYQFMAAGWYDYYQMSTGLRGWVGSNATLMTLNGSGTLNLGGHLQFNGGTGIQCNWVGGNFVRFGWNGSLRAAVDQTDLGNILVSVQGVQMSSISVNGNGYCYAWYGGTAATQFHWQIIWGLTLLDVQDADDDALEVINSLRVKRIAFTEDSPKAVNQVRNRRFALLSDDLKLSFRDAAPDEADMTGISKDAKDSEIPKNNPTDMKSDTVIAALVKAVQQLSARVAQLEAQL